VGIIGSVAAAMDRSPAAGARQQAPGKQNRIPDAAYEWLRRAAGTGWRTMLPWDGTKLPRSRRIAAKGRCHDEIGCRATQGDAHWPIK